MAKLTPDFFTPHLGFIADYIAEIFHNQLRPLNYTDTYAKHFMFGANVGHRDRKAVMRTFSGLVKLIHPDGLCQKEEMAEYLSFALEMRRRVKEQMCKINPTEFTTADLTFIDKESGAEFSISCEESRHACNHADRTETPKVREIGSLSLGETFQGYELLESLDGGGMAEAYIAKSIATGEKVFLKRVRESSKDRQALQREMCIYEKITRSGSNAALKFVEHLRDEEYVGFVTEFADGGDLASYVTEHGPLMVDEVQRIGCQVGTAISELHGLDVVHRDIKPRNILRREGNWYLVDFGISKNRSRLITQMTFQGYASHGYSAPEQYDGVEAKPSADIYAFGKLLVFMLTGNTDVDLVGYPTWRQLIIRCIAQAADERPALEHVLQELKNIPT